jgi:gas vesicle protein
MASFRQQNTAAKWARFALKCGLLLTDAKFWTSVNNQLRDRADDLGNEVKRRYDGAVDRAQDVQQAVRGRNHWLAPAMSFFGGVGLGVGLGVMLAPVSGAETRSALRSKVVNLKDRMGDMASATGTRGE